MGTLSLGMHGGMGDTVSGYARGMGDTVSGYVRGGGGVRRRDEDPLLIPPTYHSPPLLPLETFGHL